MKRIEKIIIINIIFVILGIVILPITINLMGVLNIKYSTIYKFLSSITDSIIVKASDVDYGYSGNLYISNENYWSSTEDVAVYVYSKSGKGGFLEYSLNDSNFVEFEYGTSYSESTKYFELKTTINTIVVRDRDTKNIYLKGIIINNDKGCLTLQNAVVGHDKGNEIYKLRYNNIEDNEYSIDDGTTFNDVPNYKVSGKINIEDLFNNKIIIRNKNTKEIIYKSPELGEIEESITYENGQTKVNFAVNGDAKDKTSYTYILNGEEFTGNSVTLKEDATLKLKAHTDKEFTDQTIEKDINVKVIKTEKPTIKIDEEDNLILTQGAIENDELANIYYSIDNETEKTYTGKVKLEVGTHKIKAYQITKNHQIKSLDETKEVIIKEPVKTEKPTIQMDKENNLILTQGKIENDELADIYYSVNDGEYKKYTGKVKFEVGIYKIKTYQVTKKYQIKSDIAEAEVTVKDNKEPEVKPNEDKNPSNNNDNNKDLSNDEQNNNTNSNKENKNTEIEKQKVNENKNIPKTGDMIMIYVVVLFVIITLNIVINRKRKNK
jgi:hypothetical protein